MLKIGCGGFRVWLMCAVISFIISTIQSHYLRQQLTKDNRCHMLKKPGCNVSLYKISNFEEAGWFYHAPFKSCRPFYAAGPTLMSTYSDDSAYSNAKASLCWPNRDLPLTREECEELCGDYCKLPNGELGVCMLEGSCNIRVPTTWNPRPCQAHNVQCCPKLE